MIRVVTLYGFIGIVLTTALVGSVGNFIYKRLSP